MLPLDELEDPEDDEELLLELELLELLELPEELLELEELTIVIPDELDEEVAWLEFAEVEEDPVCTPNPEFPQF